MAIISESNDKNYRGYTNSQFRYASIYVVITFVVLLILNIYCANASKSLFYQGKEGAMKEKCLLAVEEIVTLEVMNAATVESALSNLESLSVTRTMVTDQTGLVLYDSAGQSEGCYALLPEILEAMAGYDNFSCEYHDGVVQARAASPVVSYGVTMGCVYMMEYDTAQGSLIHKLQTTIFRITLILEVLLIIFSFVFALRFSRRLREIMASMRIIQQGDYTHRVTLSGTDELAFLGLEFNHLADRLNTSEEKRRRFVSDASHELKTPLASIKLLSDSILQNDMDMDTVREFVGDIGDEAERLNRMTAKLLSLTKVDGTEPHDCEIISMAHTVERVVRMLRPVADLQDITIDMDLCASCPVLILEDDLYQVIFNLVENGIKYNMAGGRITVRLHRHDDNAVLQVSDTGMGIPKEALGHIFERFYRVDKARSRATGGSGLGLAIVRTIVQRNRGEITVDSVLDQGTTFTVTFPIFDTEEGMV